jgi:hypothetical protein
MANISRETGGSTMTAAKQKPTHFRIKLDAVSLPGGMHRQGEVVAIEDISFSNQDTLGAILTRVEETGNHYRPLEAGVLKEGEFVPVPDPKSAEADKPPAG